MSNMPTDLGTLQSQGELALQNAQSHEMDAHRSLVGEALRLVAQRGGDAQQITQQAGAGNTEPAAMNAAQLVSTTLQLARKHPEIVQEVAGRFPQALPILNTVVGGTQQNEGAGLDSLLGAVVGQ